MTLPLQVHSVDEAAEFTALSSALLLNVGTLSSDWVAAMKLTAMEANRLGTPWVLDPVGAGATRYRTAVRPPRAQCLPSKGRPRRRLTHAASRFLGRRRAWICCGSVPPCYVETAPRSWRCRVRTQQARARTVYIARMMPQKPP